MWRPGQITVEIESADGPVAIVVVTTPVGTLEIIGSIELHGRVMRVMDAHVQGLTPGALGRAGLNAIGRKLMDEANVDEIVIQGGVRTTGRNRGRRPRALRFPHG